MTRRAFHRPRVATPGGLSPREWRVLALARQGLARRQIAAQLGIKVGSVNLYFQRIYETLGVHSWREAIKKAPWEQCPPEALPRPDERQEPADPTRPIT
ncbi:helix-turn-helix domain-containing protein [Thermogemmatispora sp.]|uniref:helix-turn-helix domain-containing protein n=1 Tax=Thermogemmatispora sp. TaxID=1968838 RepID=UPI001D2BED74|nr:helix-turn-helix transcriptional regulator [Thermogemmatispora sp.]MBX5449475.1 helix-turn-helix transcriptional regulator [Thermogemmatispora sp.]